MCKAMYVVYAGSSPAQSTIFVTHNFNSLFHSLTAVGQNDVWCNGSTTDFGSVSGGSNPPTLTLLFLMKIFLILSLWMIYQK